MFKQIYENVYFARNSVYELLSRCYCKHTASNIYAQINNIDFNHSL